MNTHQPTSTGVGPNDKFVDTDTLSCLSSASHYTHSPASIAQRQRNANRTKINAWLAHLEKDLDLHEHHKLRLGRIVERLKVNFSWDDVVEVWNGGSGGDGQAEKNREGIVELQKEIDGLEAVVQKQRAEIEALEQRTEALTRDFNKLIIECTELDTKKIETQGKLDRLMKEYIRLKKEKVHEGGKIALMHIQSKQR